MSDRIASIQGRTRFMAPDNAFSHWTSCLQVLFSQAQSPQDIEELMAAVEPTMLSQSPKLLFTVARGALAMTTFEADLLKSIALKCLQGALDNGDADVQQALWNTISQLCWKHANEGAAALMACLDQYADQLQLSASTKRTHASARDGLERRALLAPGPLKHQAIATQPRSNTGPTPPPLPTELWFLIAEKLATGAAPSLLALYSTASALATLGRLNKALANDLQERIHRAIANLVKSPSLQNRVDSSERTASWNPNWSTQQLVGVLVKSNWASQYVNMQAFNMSPKHTMHTLATLLQEAVAVHRYLRLSRLPLNLLAIAQKKLQKMSFAQLEQFATTVAEKLSEFDTTVQRSILLNLVCIAPSFLENALVALTDPQDIAMARRITKYARSPGMHGASSDEIDNFLSFMEATPVEQAGEPLYLALLTLTATTSLDEKQLQRRIACRAKAVENERLNHLPWQSI